MEKDHKHLQLEYTLKKIIINMTTGIKSSMRMQWESQCVAACLLTDLKRNSQYSICLKALPYDSD